MNDNGTRELQRIVCAHSFYGSKRPFQDCVLIEADPSQPNSRRRKKNSGVRKGRRKSEAEDAARADESQCEVWVAKVLALLTVHSQESDEGVPSIKGTKYREVALLQYFDCAADLDPVEVALGCVKLRWAQTDISSDDLKSDEENTYLDVLPVSTIRGRVHVVRGDYELRNKASNSRAVERPWNEQWFYINRFREPSRKNVYDKVDLMQAEVHCT